MIQLHIRPALAIMLAAVSLATAQDPQSPTLTQIRRDVEATGKVRNIELERRTGWQTMHAFSWAIELESATSREVFSAVDADREFHHGQRFRLRLESATDLYIYVLVHNADGSQVVLLPEGPEAVPLVRAGQVAYLPAPGTFRFSPPAGTERLRLLASPQKLRWVATRELFGLEHGDRLTDQQRAKALEDRTRRDESIEQAINRQAKMRRAGGLRAAIEKIESGAATKGAEVVAAEEVDRVNLVTYASAMPDAQVVIVTNIILKHSK